MLTLWTTDTKSKPRKTRRRMVVGASLLFGVTPDLGLKQLSADKRPNSGIQMLINRNTHLVMC